MATYILEHQQLLTKAISSTQALTAASMGHMMGHPSQLPAQSLAPAAPTSLQARGSAASKHSLKHRTIVKALQMTSQRSLLLRKTLKGPATAGPVTAALSSLALMTGLQRSSTVRRKAEALRERTVLMSQSAPACLKSSPPASSLLTQHLGLISASRRARRALPRAAQSCSMQQMRSAHPGVQGHRRKRK